jgi:dihydroorotate dehydrogenase (fumarate)
MANMKTTYMGLELKNPVIAGASNLTTNTENLKKMEAAGAAAIVYKSLFEELIQIENLELHERRTEYEERNAEMITLFPKTTTEQTYSVEHLANLKKAKQSVSIPVFASISAVNDDTWVEYAKKVEETGVDGLELNFYTAPHKFDANENDPERRQTETLKKVKSAVKIPVAVKLSPFYSNPLKFMHDLDNAGADALILFNRLFQPDIDIENEQIRYPYNLSNSEDSRLPLRFSGLLYGNVNASICANTGIFSGNDVVKMILAGANAVQVVSTLYLNQIDVIETILRDISGWMDLKGYSSPASFRGKLSGKNSTDKSPWYRTQYFDFHMSTSAIMNKYRVIG